MLDYLFSLSKYIPKYCAKTVYDIDFNKLYAEGKRIILTDLDNTLIPYDEEVASPKLKELISQVKTMGFTIFIISNNKKQRVAHFCDDIGCDYVYLAKKPFVYGYKKALKKLKFKKLKKEIIAIGDQIMTDVLGASRAKIECILVEPIKKKTEKWYTRINRRLEANVLRRIKKKYPEEHKKIEEMYGR